MMIGSMRLSGTGGGGPKPDRECRVVLSSALLAAVCFSGCASGPSTASTKRTETDKPASVRRVAFGEAPEMKKLAERAGQIGNEMYPKIYALLADDTSKVPRQFDIVFKKHLKPGDAGRTQGTKIRLDAKWFAKNPDSLDRILIHEMAHVTQNIKWYRGISSKSVCWGEGVAEYVRYKLGYTDRWRCPWCSANYPHYTSGYSCAGAFLLYVDATYGSNVVQQLNTELRRNSYSDKFFAGATGKSLGELWAEFQKTPAFTPVAAEVDKLYNALGYVNGTPPRNVRARFKAYLQQHGEAAHFVLTRGHARVEAGLACEISGELANDVLRLYALYQYLKEATKAAEFVTGLGDKGQLPGLPKGELRISLGLSDLENDCEVDSISRTVSFSRNGDSSTYHYMVVQASKDSAWKLQRAWRRGPDGRDVEEYSVP